MSGIDISKIQQKKTAPAKEKAQRDLLGFMNRDISLLGSALSDRKKETFYTELGILLDAGMDIRSALELIEQENEKEKDRKLFRSIQTAIVKGASLSTALNESGKFSDYEYYSVNIGEETGKLTEVLKELALFYKKKITQKRQVISALSYPVVILTVSIGAVIFMMNFIVPMFSDIFKRLDGDLPAITQLVIDASDVVSRTAGWVFLVLATVAGVLYWQRNKTWFRRLSARLILSIPFFGDLIRKIHLARFCNVMALLISSKIPLLQAITLVRKMVSFYPIEASLEKIERDILQGESLHESMAQFPVYFPRMISLVKVGEEVNQLDVFFKKIADQYHEEVEHQTSVLGTLVEPFMIIFLGLVVGTILIAMYLPLFQLSASFGG